jgi:predicted nucleic acid-binding protein
MRQQEVRTAVTDLDGELFRCAVADLEMGFSASNLTEHDVLVDVISPFHLLNPSPMVWADALDIQRKLAAAGLKGRKPMDLVVAAVAMSKELTVIHYDADFEHIASVVALS